MPDTQYVPRRIKSLLDDALSDTPAVLIHGPRQCGKTTLAQVVCEPKGYEYFGFDDDTLAAAALSDPIGFVSDLPDKAILDEVQRAPGIFTTLKLVIDRDRRPGRFVLTGSANTLLIPQLADSLAGRMEILRLHPLSQRELEGEPRSLLHFLWEGNAPRGSVERLGDNLLERICAGGYPAALTRQADRRRATWYRDYVETLIQRDIRDLAHIRRLDVIPRLLALTAAQTAQLLNVSELAAPFQISRPTIHDYVTLLENIFLLDITPPWFSNRLKRLLKSPKVHIGDTGIACALLGLDKAALKTDRTILGHILETFVYQELRRDASGSAEPHRFRHFRDRDGYEVDIVVERGHQIVGIEVKAAATVTEHDFRGLRKLQQATGDSFVAGCVLYDGETCAGFGDRLHAIPIRLLWES